ncbi:hypothetical protein ABKN59_000589 [Abortiporus biennis]
MLPHRRTFAECDSILCGPGMPHEMETRLIDGRLQRVYKHMWSSLREFWIASATTFKDSTYIVYGDSRLTYDEVFQTSMKAASVLRSHGIVKGDRIAICAHNCSDYLVAFWACQLIGAISVHVNAWLPIDPLVHCFSHTSSKIVLVDAERAQRILPAVSNLRSSGITSFFVIDTLRENLSSMPLEFLDWTIVVNQHHIDPTSSVNVGHCLTPEDDAVIMFTSGTTGLPRGVLSTHRQFLTNMKNSTVASSRATLRSGGNLGATSHLGPQKGTLVAVPLFHVSGLTSFSMMATMTGMKIVLSNKWVPGEAARLTLAENIRTGGGVPMIVSDLLDSDALKGYPFEFFLFGAMLTHAFGMTETNAVSVALAGEDYESKPTSCGIPCPVNDMLIVKDGQVLPNGEEGEVWLRGPNVMKCYWNDPDATAKVLTKDGWYKTGDLGLIDEEGYLHIRDRIKDLIIRGGENVDSVSVENAIAADGRVLEVAVVGIPDARWGELVAALVVIRSEYYGAITGGEVIEFCRDRLPKFAVPVMVLLQDHPFVHTQSGKIMKAPLRVIAREEWARRNRDSTSSRL